MISPIGKSFFVWRQDLPGPDSSGRSCDGALRDPIQSCSLPLGSNRPTRRSRASDRASSFVANPALVVIDAAWVILRLWRDKPDVEMIVVPRLVLHTWVPVNEGPVIEKDLVHTENSLAAEQLDELIRERTRVMAI
jgi:hypothetical protein